MNQMKNTNASNAEENEVGMANGDGEGRYTKNRHEQNTSMWRSKRRHIKIKYQVGGREKVRNANAEIVRQTKIGLKQIILIYFIIFLVK